MTLRCRHRGPGAGRGGRAAEAGRGPKSGYLGGRLSESLATLPGGDLGKPTRRPALLQSARSWGSELGISGQSGERGGGAVGRWRTPGRNELPFGARGVLAVSSAPASWLPSGGSYPSRVRVLPLPAGVCLLSFLGSLPSVD